MIAGLILKHVSPAGRVTLARWTFDISLLAWPVSHVLIWTLAGEHSLLQHAILALSWWAITSTAWDVVSTADVRETQESDA